MAVNDRYMKYYLIVSSAPHNDRLPVICKNLGNRVIWLEVVKISKRERERNRV